MRQARALLPYGVVALLVVLSSTLILARSLGDAGLTQERAGRAVAPSASGPRVQLPELSRTSRLAYWKAELSGDSQLWAANGDGSQRRPIATVDDLKKISLTRWSASGAAVGYVLGGNQLVIARLDGTKQQVEGGDAQRGDPFKIIDVRWSPSGAKVAATIQRLGSLRMDVYVAILERPIWRAITTLENVIGTDWASEDEILYWTSAGAFGVARVDGVNKLRPLSGLRAISPWLGDDGRVYFLVGDSISARDQSQPLPTIQSASVWSVRYDGADPKREPGVPQDDVRLDGRWADGRWLVHQSYSGNFQYLWGGANITAIASNAGGVERVSLSADRRSAIGFGASRILKIDAARTTGTAPPADTAGVLLEAVGDADAWFPKTAPRVLSPLPIAVAHPAARYAFSLGGDLWTMDQDGAMTLLRGANDLGANLRRFGTLPARWSPKGDMLLTAEVRGGTGSAFTMRPIVIDRTGQITRFDDLPNFATPPVLVWSPDGTAFAVATVPAGASNVNLLEIRFVAVPGGAPVRSPLAGRDVAWAKSGIFILGNGILRADLNQYTGQALSLIVGDSVRVVTDAAKLAADPAFGIAPARLGFMTLAEISASSDGTYAGVRVVPASGSSSGGGELWWSVLRASDGTATFRRPGNTVGDVAWSPSANVVAFTSTDITTIGRPQKVVIVDAATGASRDAADGRFAGWSPDGAWTYVAHNDGLWAYPTAAGTPVRISPVGVPVAATAP